ncbi:MAG: HEPN domain-containing protein [Anaerolineae bacterium]|nr:HEPN domain-containing protein [Anaerolineae bacterium]
MNEILADWINKAEGDYNTARRELTARRKPNYDAVCFHAQQCAEKYLKAFLVSHEIDPPRTHNLIELLKLCSAKDGTFELLHPSLDLLNAYAVDIRYPGEFSTKDEARDAVKAMKHVREFVRSKLLTNTK